MVLVRRGKKKHRLRLSGRGSGLGPGWKSRILEVLDIIQHPVFVLHFIEFIHHTSLPMCYVTLV